MKSLTPEQRSKRIKRLVNKWRPILFLGEWDIQHRYISSDGPESQNGKIAAAEISVNYPYKSALIKTYRNFWESTFDDQDSMIAHELSHCHTQELWDFCTNFQNGKYHTPDEVWRAVETLTQRISIIAKYGGK